MAMESYSPPLTSAIAAATPHGEALRAPAPGPAPLFPSARPPPPPPLLPRTAPSASSTSQPAAAITSDDIRAQVKAMKKKVDKLLSRITTRFNVMLVRVEAMVEALEGDGGTVRPNLEELDAIITEMSFLKLDLHSIITELEFIDNELHHCLFLCDFLD